jgi:sigma-B regulation protein RsbU (phosphoserine phosphatase)
VGGDLYDFLQFDDRRIGLVIADVSGKGIPAALLMAGLQASMRSLAVSTISPCEVNRRLNEMLLRSTSMARYATLFFGHLDVEGRILTYSNAGHHPPVLLNAKGAVYLRTGGPPIGLLDDAVYGEGQMEMGVGDLLALCTDGIIEAPGQDGEEFGVARLLDTLRANRDLDLDDIVRIVVDDVKRWSGGRPPHDDVTLMLARIT